ncbi:MAG: hypothetical protein ACRD3D_01525 [Terriglobia bacterium]
MRLNDSTEGPWLSPDPLGGDITNPQSLNRYAYALNNPTTLTDHYPLRETLEEIPKGAVGGKPVDPQQRLQGPVRSQQPGVREPPRPRHDRHQKRRERLARIDGVR